ncbi:MAG TPA: N-acetylneuraminate synthase [Caldisericia bacterium]|nr:N-acetylneuraminate synthase [Caldisericia bacterium]
MSGTPFLTKNTAYIIAEAGVNHNGDITKALCLVDEAKKSGADAVKFQTFIAAQLISKEAKMADYQKENIGKETSQLEMIKQFELSFADFVVIKEYCDKVNIQFLSTPFDYESVDFIDSLVPFFKISSGEITNYPFLKYIAKKKKPIILSTGMSTLSEVEKALDVLTNEGCKDIVLLHCTTNYPCPYDEVNLNAMQTIRDAFKLPVGYSDHTLGIEVPIAAVTMGAKVIEKHFTLDKNLLGPDHKASLDPQELAEMVKAIRNIESALGDGIKKPNQSELEVMSVARKSLVATRDLKANEIVKESDIAIKRPGNGIKPEYIDVVLGKKLLRDVEEDELLSWECFFQL